MEKFDPGMEKAVKMAATFTEIDLLISPIGLRQHMVKRAVKFKVLAFLETNPQQKKTINEKSPQKKVRKKKKTFRDLIRGGSEIRGSRITWVSKPWQKGRCTNLKAKRSLRGDLFTNKLLIFVGSPGASKKPLKIDVKLKISPLFWGWNWEIQNEPITIHKSVCCMYVYIYMYKSVIKFQKLFHSCNDYKEQPRDIYLTILLGA